MLAVPFLMSMVAYADTTDLAHRLQIHLSAASRPWLVRHERRIDKLVGDAAADLVFDIEVNRKGGLTRVRRSRSSGKKPLDRMVRGMFQVVPPLAKAPVAAKGNTPCVVHIRIEGSPRDLAVDAACFPAGGTPVVAAHKDKPVSRAVGRLFDGYGHEASDNETMAVAAFRAACDAEPDWYTATVALGLALARTGNIDEARPLLRKAAKQRRPNAEIKRYLAARNSAETSNGGDEAETSDDAEVSSCERDESEIFVHIKKSLGRLTTCAEAEHHRNPKLDMPESVPVSFAITPEGPIRSVAIEHRFYRNGEFNRCVQQALNGRLKPSGGSACPVQFELNLGAVDD